MSTDLDLVRERLRAFAQLEAQGASPLYAHLAEQAAADDEVAGLLTVAPPEFARPTLLLAAAHRLVIAEPISDLAHYYPSVGGDYGVDTGTWRLFRAFVLERAEAMRTLVTERTTQTNEVRRAALLFPAVVAAARQAGAPVGLLEVGTSAGLLLGMDRYGYRYDLPDGERIAAGPTKTPLVLPCELTVASGGKRPALPKKLAVHTKVGLDRRPVDLRDEDELAWLEACVWADQPERLRTLGAAAAMQAKDRPQLVAGDAVDDLASAAALVPEDVPLVVFSSHTMPYLTQPRRAEFVAALGELGARRPLWWLSQEAYGAGLHLVLPGLESETEGPRNTLGFVRWRDGRPEARALARTADHGQRIEWTAA